MHYLHRPICYQFTIFYEVLSFTLLFSRYFSLSEKKKNIFFVVSDTIFGLLFFMYLKFIIFYTYLLQINYTLMIKQNGGF